MALKKLTALLGLFAVAVGPCNSCDEQRTPAVSVHVALASVEQERDQCLRQ